MIGPNEKRIILMSLPSSFMQNALVILNQHASFSLKLKYFEIDGFNFDFI